MAIFNSYVSLPEGTTPKSSDYSHGNLAQPFLFTWQESRGADLDLVGVRETKREFLAMDGNGQHANIWYILKDPALKGTNLFNLFPLIFSYFQHHFICKDHGQIHRNFHHVSIDFPFLWGHPGRSGLEDGIHWMILGSTGKAVRHGGFHSWLGDDSLISRKKCCRGWSHMLWDPEKGVFDIKYRVYRGMGLATINPTLSVWMWDDWGDIAGNIQKIWRYQPV